MKLAHATTVVPALAVIFLAFAAGCNQSPSLTPPPSLSTYTLSVNTSNPTTGIPITISYADNSGATNGTAAFTRSYNSGTAVVLTAPATAGSNLFSSWTGCTSVSGMNCSVTVTANTTVTANYAPPPNYTLTINSVNPASGVAMGVAPADNSSATAGSTSFTRSYVTGTGVSITAPATAGTNTFGSWAGCTTASAITCNVTLTSDRTITATYNTPAMIYQLTVNSSNPASGTSIAVSPADNSAKSSGVTGTSSTFGYAAGTVVTLTAPATSGANLFQGWSGCSTATFNSLSCTVNVSAAKSVTANYYPAPGGNIYFVSPTGSDNNTGLSTATAFLTLQKAAVSTHPGDAVYAMNGTYTGATPTSTVLSISTPGTAAAGIAYRAYPGQTPVISFSSFTGIGFGQNAAYIEVSGFTINGNNQNVTYAQASTADAIANPGNYPQFNGNCVFADNRTSTGNHPNHLNILNNTVSNCGAGIGMNGTDYITISGNTVFNCAWYDAYGTSAVSLLASYNTDNITGYKNFITGNRIYNNYELIPYHVTSPLQITDGEGIIIDTNQNSSISSSGIPYAAYTGRTLIANNVIYANGSSAIEVFQSSHVDVVNNSTYGNVHTPAATSYATPSGRGELYLSRSSDVNAYNNVLYSYTNQNPYVQSNCTSCTLDYNIYYNGTNVGTAANGPNDLFANPSYVSPANQDFTKVDMSVSIGSPAIDSGTATLAPATDFNGASRPAGKAVDRGAYEQ